MLKKQSPTGGHASAGLLGRLDLSERRLPNPQVTGGALDQKCYLLYPRPAARKKIRRRTKQIQNGML
jgi:hypothetical protein